MENEIPIDLSYFYSITGGNKSFEQKLLSGTVADVNTMVAGLNTAWESKNAEAVKTNAHSLISLSAIAGMPKVEQWSRLLDNAFTDGTFHTELQAVANSIISGWPAAHAKLKAVIAGEAISSDQLE